MRASGRLAVYAATLAGVFAVAFVTAGAVVPPEAVGSWSSGTGGHANDHGPQQQQEGHPSSADADGHGEQRAAMPAGLSLQADGYRLAAVDAPTTPGASGDLTLTVLGPDGEPATDFAVSHEQELHLIVVRTDGGEFRHVHPEVDPRGRRSIPWEWQSSGTYRVYADFVSSGAEASTTLSALVHVAGDFEPLPVEKTSRSTEAGGYLVTITGDLAAGRASTLTVSVTRGAAPGLCPQRRSPAGASEKTVRPDVGLHARTWCRSSTPLVSLSTVVGSSTGSKSHMAPIHSR